MEYSDADTYYYVSSSGFSTIGGFKSWGTEPGTVYTLWDTGGQPSSIGPWNVDAVAGGGWIYTISLPIYWDKDHDHDGMPMAYEEQFAEWDTHTMWDYNAFDASEDWDGDGFTNIQEYLCRSDPTDGESFFQFTDIRLVTSEGRPQLAWWSTTTSIKGMERYAPNYPSNLGFDILYADWTVAQQAGTGGEATFPNDDWFNQTGTWELVSGATDLKRDGEFNTYTDDIAGGDMSEGDIRFYRLAIGGTWDQGTPVWEATDYYSEVGEPKLCSTVAREILMIQKHVISSDTEMEMLSLSGENTGSDGKLDYVLGKYLFPSGSMGANATNLNLWIAPTATMTAAYLLTNGTWDGYGGKINGDNGFRFTWYSGYEPLADITFYAGAQLKMDAYSHEINQRDWSSNTQVVTPGDPDWGNPANTRATYFSYNFPVAARFIADFSPDFPTLAGNTEAPPFTGWEFLENDYVMFYNRDITQGTDVTVGIYYDHSTHHRWEYFLPFSKLGNAVGDELVLSPGSPGVVIQYWNPNDTETGWTITDPVPYQHSGDYEIKTYLKIN